MDVDRISLHRVSFLRWDDVKGLAEGTNYGRGNAVNEAIAKDKDGIDARYLASLRGYRCQQGCRNWFEKLVFFLRNEPLVQRGVSRPAALRPGRC